MSDTSIVVLTGTGPIRDAWEGQNGNLNLEMLLSVREEGMAMQASWGMKDVERGADRTVGVSKRAFKSAAGVQEVKADDCLAIARMPELDIDKEATKGHVLALDKVSDPGNLGTILRTANAIGWSDVFLLPGCCDVWNEKVIKAGRGAQFGLGLSAGPLEELEEIVERRKGVFLAADPRGEKLESLISTGRLDTDGLCLVLGNEGNGISDEILQKSRLVSIEMTGSMESLNVGVAAGILMYLLRSPKT